MTAVYQMRKIFGEIKETLEALDAVETPATIQSGTSREIQALLVGIIEDVLNSYEHLDNLYEMAQVELQLLRGDLPDSIH